MFPEKIPEKTLSVGETLYDLMSANGWRAAEEWRRTANKIAPTLVGGSKKHGGPDLAPTRARKAWAELGVDGRMIGNAFPPPVAMKIGLQFKKVLDYERTYCRSDKKYHKELLSSDARLAASMGNDYMVALDVVIYRETEANDIINEKTDIIDDSVCNLADIRKSNGGLPILHASISAKWTMCSDRAQNSRTEALGLIRNRKGHLPHIVVVTGEPMPV